MNKILIMIAILFFNSTIYAQTFSRKYNEAENRINWPKEFDPKISDFYVHNEIEINATPDQVWQLLIQAKDWISWYDGIQNIRFEDSIQVQLAKNTKVFWNSMGQSLNNTVVEFEPNKTLSWQFNEAKIQGYHAWVIIPTANGCRVITDESQTGKLAKLQKIFIPKKLMKQHDNWLKLLKMEAEKSSSSLGFYLSDTEEGFMVTFLNKSYDNLISAVHELTAE
ncbi:MAG: SRPBCC domain-containing protein [Cyclobacteriaceae bacterium]